MHLSHTIPWNGISRHFEFIRDHKAFYGCPTGLFAKQDDRTESDLLHFVRVFVDTVDEFSATERKKFPAKMDTSLPLFPDDLLDPESFHLQPWERNNNRCLPLVEEMQQVSYWKKKGVEGFSTAHGYLADSVKFLIQQHQSRALLTLCQAVPLVDLFDLSWGHGFGVNLNAYESFRIYVLLNVAYSVQQAALVENKKKFNIFDLPELRKLVINFFDSCDYSVQYVSHRQFWEKYVQNVTDDGVGTTFTDPAETDAADLKKYLANCFRDIYLYDMMRKEMGKKKTKEFWMHDFILNLNRMFDPLWLPVPELTYE